MKVKFNLNELTCKELREIAKGYNITGRWDMTKDELINAISKVEANISCKDVDIEFETDCAIKGDMKTNPEGSQKVTKTTLEYLKTAEPGTLIAFTRGSEKKIAMSGKFIGIEENGKIAVESKKGTIFKLNPSNIIWVKTGWRWPRWVFEMFNNRKVDKEANDDVVS